VLDALSDRGFIKVIPGRPKQFQSKSPEAILDRAVENQRQYEQFEAELDSRREAFLSEYDPLFERATESVTPTSDFRSTSSTWATPVSGKRAESTTTPRRNCSSCRRVSSTSTRSAPLSKRPSTGDSTSLSLLVDPDRLER